MARRMTSWGIGAAPYVITLKLERSCWGNSGWSISCLSMVGTNMERVGRSRWASSSHCSESNCCISTRVRPP